jgi:diadenosine tetraphosphate (Ap4A) HIT family hydrolase
LFDYELWANDDLVVVPAVGALAEGYILLIPRRHESSTAWMPPDVFSRLADAKAMVRRVLKETYGPPIFFEHGIITPTNRSGACVEHVHIHCVATSIDLIPVLADVHGGALKEIQHYAEVRKQAENGQSYVYYESQDGRMFLLSDMHLPSQYVRRLLARGLGYDGVEWDYAVFDFRENVQRTVAALSGASWSL